MKDRVVFDALKSIVARLPEVNSPKLSWLLFSGAPQGSCPFLDADSHEDLASILGEDSEIFVNLEVSFATPRGEGWVRFERDEAGSTSFALRSTEFWDSTPRYQAVVAAAFRQPLTGRTRMSLLGDLEPQIAEYYNRREETLNRLEDLYANSIRNADAQRRTREQDLDEEKRALRQQHEERLKQIDLEKAAAEANLVKRAAILTAREKELDDRSNTHARRDIHRRLKEGLQERNKVFKLTAETAAMRFPVLVAFVLLNMLLSALVIWAFVGTTHPLPEQPFWFPLLRFGVSLAALAGSVMFFIRWQDRWSEAHASEEFRLKRLDLDVDRASWLVETMLEWRAVEGPDLPDKLIEHLANGLFEKVSSGPLASHPAQDMIAALLASPSSVKLNFPGGAVGLDRKSLKDAARQADSEPV